jgi:hypothetical protein
VPTLVDAAGHIAMARVAVASPNEIVGHRAAYEARTARIDAKIEAERLARESEALRRATPSFLTDDELREKRKVSQEFAVIALACGRACGRPGRTRRDGLASVA